MKSGKPCSSGPYYENRLLHDVNLTSIDACTHVPAYANQVLYLAILAILLAIAGCAFLVYI